MRSTTIPQSNSEDARPQPLVEFNLCHSPADGKFCSGTGSVVSMEEARERGLTQRDPSDVRVFKSRDITQASLTQHLAKHGFKPDDSIEHPKGVMELYQSKSGLAYAWRPKVGRGRDAAVHSVPEGLVLHPVRYRHPTYHVQTALVDSSTVRRQLQEFNSCHSPADGKFCSTATGGVVMGGRPASPQATRRAYGKAQMAVTAGRRVRSSFAKPTTLGKEIQALVATNVPLSRVFARAKQLVLERAETPEEREHAGFVAQIEVETALALARGGDSKWTHTVPSPTGRRYTEERLRLHDSILAMSDINNPNAKSYPIGQQPTAVFMGGLPAPLALDTPVPTPTGWTTIGAIQLGDMVFGPDGLPTQVESVSPIFEDRRCFELIFDDGETLVADAEHQWPVQMSGGLGWDNPLLAPTEEISGAPELYSIWCPADGTRRLFRSVRPVPSVPVRCLRVMADSHLFLVGQGIPTCNSGKSSAVGDLENGPFGKNAVVINNDVIKAKLPGYRGHNAHEFHEESSDIAERHFQATIKARKNLIYDFTFKTESTMQARMEKLKAAGYRIEVRFTDTDVNTSVASALHRATKEERRFRAGESKVGGRYIPIEHIRNSLRVVNGQRTSQNRQTFERLKRFYDAYMIVDNNGLLNFLRKTGKDSKAKLIERVGRLTESSAWWRRGRAGFTIFPP